MQHADSVEPEVVTLVDADPVQIDRLTAALAGALAGLTPSARGAFMDTYRSHYGGAATRWLDWAAPPERPPRAKLSRVLLTRLLAHLPAFLDADGRLALATAIWRRAGHGQSSVELRVPAGFKDEATMLALVEEYLNLGLPSGRNSTMDHEGEWLRTPLLVAHAEGLKRLLAADRVERLAAIKAQLHVVLARADSVERLDMRFEVTGHTLRVCTDPAVSVPVLVVLDGAATSPRRYSPLLPWALGWFVVGVLVGLLGWGVMRFWAP